MPSPHAATRKTIRSAPVHEVSLWSALLGIPPVVERRKRTRVVPVSATEKAKVGEKETAAGKEEPKKEEKKEGEQAAAGGEKKDEAPKDDKPKEAASADAATVPAPAGIAVLATSASGETWTVEEDVQLLNLKAQKGSSWKSIAGALGKAPKHCKVRFKELIAATEKGTEKVATTEEKGNAWDVKPEKEKNKKKDDEQQQNEAKEKGGEVRYTEQQWKAMREDREFSFDEMQILMRLVHIYEDDRWLAVASGFYDRTGRRVHPDVIKKRFLQGEKK